MTTNNFNPEAKKKGEKMVIRSLSVELNLWEAAQRKAGFAPISAIIRALLRAWLAGKINLNDYED